MEEYLKRLNKTLELFTALMLALMVVLVFLQVVSRSFFGYSFPWTEEVSRFLMIWVTFIGSSVALYYGSHIRIETVIAKMKPERARWVNFIAILAVLLFIFILFFGGINLMTNMSFQRSAALQIPMSFVYLVIPVSAVFMLLNVISILVKNFSRVKVGNDP